MTLENTIKILEHIAEMFHSDSEENKAILKTIEVLSTTSYNQNNNNNLTGFDILQMKFYGLDIPDKLQTLESDIDLLITKIHKFNIQ
jgi:hypothetical protein